jgi:hypothetical protein
MERMTLREAAERTSRSVTTLRRYIRSGRLHAEKRYGRFGPEYFISEKALVDSGLKPVAEKPPVAAIDPRGSSLPAEAGTIPVARLFGEVVPLVLYQDLQMKHDQLLVQYGMVRGGGLRLTEFHADLEEKQGELEIHRNRITEQRKEFKEESSQMRDKLRRAHLELQGKSLEIAALQEKVRALEMLTRNADTNAAIEKQFNELLEQARKVDDLKPAGSVTTPLKSPWPKTPTKHTEPEH